MSDQGLASNFIQLVLNQLCWVRQPEYMPSVTVTIGSPPMQPPCMNNVNIRVDVVGFPYGGMQNYADNGEGPLPALPAAANCEQEQPAAPACARCTNEARCYYHSENFTTAGLINLLPTLMQNLTIDEQQRIGAHLDVETLPCGMPQARSYPVWGNDRFGCRLLRGIEEMYMGDELDSIRTGFLLRFADEDLDRVSRRALEERMYEAISEVDHRQMELYYLNQSGRFYLTKDLPRFNERTGALNQLAMLASTYENRSAAWFCCAFPDAYDFLRCQANFTGLPIEMILGEGQYQMVFQEYGLECSNIARNIRDLVYPEYITRNLSGCELFGPENPDPTRRLELEALQVILRLEQVETLQQDVRIPSNQQQGEQPLDNLWSSLEIAETLLFHFIDFFRQPGFHPNRQNIMMRLDSVKVVETFLRQNFNEAGVQEIYNRLIYLLLVHDKVMFGGYMTLWNNLSIRVRWHRTARHYNLPFRSHVDRNKNNANLVAQFWAVGGVEEWEFLGATADEFIPNADRSATLVINNMNPVWALCLCKLMDCGLVEVEPVIDQPGNAIVDLQQFLRYTLHMVNEYNEEMENLLDNLVPTIYEVMCRGWSVAFLKERSRVGIRWLMHEAILPFQELCLCGPLSGKVAEFKTRKNKYLVYYVEDENQYVMEVCDEHGTPIVFPTSGEPQNITAENLAASLASITCSVDNPFLIFIIVASNLSAAKVQIRAFDLPEMGTTIVVSPLLVDVFGMIYRDSPDKLLHMIHFAEYSLEDPIGGCCVILKMQNQEGDTPFRLHTTHVTERMIGKLFFERSMCTMLQIFLSYYRINCSLLVTQSFERYKLNVLLGREAGYFQIIGAALDDVAGLNEWRQLLRSKRLFLQFIRLNQEEIERLCLYFMSGCELDWDVLDNAWIDISHRERLLELHTIAEWAAYAQTGVGDRALTLLNQRTGILNRLQGRDPRNTEHPVKSHVYYYRGSLWDLKNIYSVKMFLGHFMTYEIARAIWEANPERARLFRVPQDQGNIFNPLNIVPFFQLHYSVNACMASTLLLSVIQETRHLPVHMLYGKTRSTMFLAYNDLPREIQLASTQMIPLFNLAHHTTWITHRITYKQLPYTMISLPGEEVTKYSDRADRFQTFIRNLRVRDAAVAVNISNFWNRADILPDDNHYGNYIVEPEQNGYLQFGMNSLINEHAGHIEGCDQKRLYSMQQYAKPVPIPLPALQPYKGKKHQQLQRQQAKTQQAKTQQPQTQQPQRQQPQRQQPQRQQTQRQEPQPGISGTCGTRSRK